MTINLTAGEKATQMIVAVDLSLLGAVGSDDFETLGADLPVEYASYPQLASCAHAAARGSIDFVCLSTDFHSRSDAPNELDAARVASRLLSQEAGHVSAQVPLDPEAYREALDILGEGGVSASLAIALETGFDRADLEGFAVEVRSRGFLFNCLIRPDQLTAQELAWIGENMDQVRLLTEDIEYCAQVRANLRKSAEKAGRTVAVLSELGVVISGSLLAANERAILVEAMGGSPLFEGKPSVVGTVYDVADAIERWVGNGACDGVVILPASLPTDLASMIRGVIPLLEARAHDIAV